MTSIKKVVLCVLLYGGSIFIFKKYKSYMHYLNKNKKTIIEINYEEFKKNNELETISEVNKSSDAKSDIGTIKSTLEIDSNTESYKESETPLEVKSNIESVSHPKTPPNTPIKAENKINPNIKETSEDPIIIMAI